MKKIEEKYLEALKKFRLIDDTFFSACFDNNEADVQYILRIILEKPDLEVLKVQTQKSVENMYGRSVRFDVFATDKAGKLYNIEVQRSNSGAVPARARYNSAMLDYHKLKKKAKFNELTETFRSAIKNWHLTPEDAMNGLDISPELQKELRPLI